MAKQLNPKGPSFRKLEKLFDLMNEMGISFHCRTQYLTFTVDGIEVKIKDTDTRELEQDFPPSFEFVAVLTDNNRDQ